MPSARPERFLALDYGERRVGLAVSDDLGMYAHPRSALPGGDDVALTGAIQQLVHEDGIDTVVVGLPVSLDGSESAQTAVVRAFVSRLRAALTVPVIEADERFSSSIAADALRGRERRRSGQRDSAAAAIVLQSLLDARRGGSER